MEARNFPNLLGKTASVSNDQIKRVIIACSDENALVRLESAFLLEDDTAEGYEFSVRICTIPEQVIALHTKIHPDVVLIHSSIGLVEASNLSLHIRANEGERHTGIILVCDQVVDRRQAVEFLEKGADEFFSSEANAREIRARVNAVLRLKALSDRLRTANHKLELLSNTDELTGLANMRLFYKKYAESVLECRDGKIPLGMIMFDLDHFKCVNDSTNHLIGSYVIGEVGKIVRMSGILHKADVAARYGGDEYIVLTHDLDIALTVRKAEAIRALIESAIFSREGITVNITASMGVAWVAPGFAGSADDLMKAADLMCYRSKKRGRNQVSSLRFESQTDLSSLTDDHSRRITVRFDRKKSVG